MAIKLGELLLKEGLITPEQLDEALKNQAIYGIKLGSALIELEFITDEELCVLLSRKLGVPSATAQALSWIPPQVLALVPAELAAKHRVVPIRLEGKKLALAMADPADFEAIDEVAFVSSCVIVPHIAPELRITDALSKYYRIIRDTRYRQMEGQLDYKRKSSSAAATNDSAAEVANPMTEMSRDLLNIGVPPERAGDAARHASTPPARTLEHYTIDQLSIDFASAANRDQIADIFIKYLGQEFNVCALFIIRNNMGIGWRGVAEGKRLKALENMTIPLSELSVLRTVLESGKYSMGTFKEVTEDLQLLGALGLESGTPLLVLPIVMVEKVVAEVIVSADIEALDMKLKELQKLVSKASMAFEILILKNKILMT